MSVLYLFHTVLFTDFEEFVDVEPHVVVHEFGIQAAEVGIVDTLEDE